MGIELTKQNLEIEEDVQEKQEENEIEIADRGTMLERGIFKANGYTFVVKPILLKEVDEYMSDELYMPRSINEDGSPKSDKELAVSLLSLFRKFDDADMNQTKKPVEQTVKRKKFSFKKVISNKFDYSDFKYAAKLVKWLERKVYIKNKPIVFDDLETKYKLTKGEICKMILYLSDSSGF